MQPQIKDKLTRREVVKAVNITYKQRDKLVKNLRDRRGVAGVLSKIIALFLLVICGIIFITIIGLDVSAFLSPVTTAVLAISFIFGGMASNAFKSFVFLFSVNAFDVGDRIAISSSQARAVHSHYLN
jgi:small-conductance mechanosensitive channel